jgi:anti-sigma regulatory factor (Ser/Thr protein kinase)
VSSVVLLPYAAASVSAARWHLAADLRSAGIAESAVGDATLVVSELLSNAIRHARPLPGSTVRVKWALSEGWLEVSVEDGGASTHPRASRPSLSSLGGRGLAIVEHLSSNWGVETNGRGTTVWAVLAAPGPAPGTTPDPVPAGSRQA